MTDIWPDILRVALLGSERVALRPDTLETLATLGLSANAPSGDPSAAETTPPDQGDSAGFILRASFAAYQARRAGYLPIDLSAAPTLAAPPEDLSVCSESAMRALEHILNHERRILPEFIHYLHAAQQRLPEEGLPVLLNLGRKQPELWPALRRIIGERGEWLAAQNPNWHYILPNYDIKTWHTGSPSERITLLQHWRHVDPSVALELLTATWEEEAIPDKLDFLKVFRIHLSDEDLPLLHRAAQHPRQEVRIAAHDLITQIPNAPYTQRLLTRLTELLTLKRTLTGRKLDIQLPEEDDKALLKDFRPSHNLIESGERGLLLARLIEAAPLDPLCAHYGCTPLQWIHLYWHSEWQPLLMQALIYAIRRQANTAWAGRLMEFWIIDQQKEIAADRYDYQPLLDTCTPEQFDRVCSHAFAKLTIPPAKGGFLETWMSHHTEPWGAAWSRQWAIHFRNWYLSGKEMHHLFSYTRVLNHIAYYLDPEASIPILQPLLESDPHHTQAVGHSALATLLRPLHFRANMRRSLTPSPQ